MGFNPASRCVHPSLSSQLDFRILTFDLILTRINSGFYNERKKLGLQTIYYHHISTAEHVPFGDRPLCASRIIHVDFHQHTIKTHTHFWQVAAKF